MSQITSQDKVLFVDDEVMVLQSIQRGLINEPFEKYFANSEKEALEILEENGIVVMVTDLKMPGMGGLELLKIVRETYPDIVPIVLTGFYQVSTILSAINAGHIHRYLTKPWRMEEEFIPTIRQAIEYHHIMVERKQLIVRLTQQNDSLIQKNEEILRLKELAESSDQAKTKILNHLTKEIVPYLANVVQTTYELTGIENPAIQLIAKDLNKRGQDILELLRKVEGLLKNKQ